MAKLSKHSNATEYVFPGKELANDRVRSICKKLVREQGWRYSWAGGAGYPQLITPEGAYLRVPKTPDNHWNFERKAKRMGAVLDGEAVPIRTRREHGTLSSEGVVFSHLSDSEWREAQRGQGWREKVAGLEPEPEPEPPAPLTSYAQGVLARANGSRVLRDDARGDGAWTLAQARQMLRDGYSLDNVMARTGWGRMWLADLAERLATG